MNRSELIKRIKRNLSENEVHKKLPSKVNYHISDDCGNTAKFTVKFGDERYEFESSEISAILDAFSDVILDALRHGETVPFRDVGIFRLRFKRGRRIRIFGTDEYVTSVDEYMPKYSFSQSAKDATRTYTSLAKDADTNIKRKYEDKMREIDESSEEISPELRDLLAMDSVGDDFDDE